MRFTGRKRKKDPPDEGQPSSQRTRDDILNVDFTSILPQKENPQNIPTKKPRLRPLHCRECDNKFTSAEALERHYQNKTNNIGSQIILAKNFKKDGSQTISCRESSCCYSCNKLADIYAHDRANHESANFKTGYKYRVISIVNIIDNLAPEVENYCHKCLKNFVKKEKLIAHKKKCTGKQMFACSICGAGFQSHEAMVEHVKRFHKFDSSFKTTGIFIGKSRVKTRGSKTPLGHVYEKCHVPLTPGLNHINQVLTPHLKQEIQLFLKKQVVVNTTLNYHFVLSAVLGKPESGGRVKRIQFNNRTLTERISRNTDIRKSIEISALKLQRMLDVLSNTESGNYYYNRMYHIVIMLYHRVLLREYKINHIGLHPTTTSVWRMRFWFVR
jgi:hypothetical protein